MQKEDVQMFLPALLPQGDEPGECQDKKDKNAQPKPHFDDFFYIFVGNKKCKNAKPGNNNTYESFCIEGEGARDIKKDVAQQLFSVTVRQVSHYEKTHGTGNKKSERAIDYYCMGYPEVLPCGCEDDSGEQCNPGSKQEIDRKEQYENSGKSKDC